MTEDVSNADIAKTLAPFLVATALATAFLVLLALRFIPMFHAAGQVEVVSFDVVKYTNSQRAIASTFVKKDADASTAGELLLNLPDRTRGVIAEVAGAGALVVVKQAVVQGQTRDITDDVLKRLGMPVSVPTSDAPAFALDVAPTMMLTPAKERVPTPLGGELTSKSKDPLP